MKKHSVKRFDQWVNESYVNEGIGDVFRGAKEKMTGAMGTVVKAIGRIPGLKWLGDKFAGTNSWFLNKVVSGDGGKSSVQYITSDDSASAVKEVDSSAPVQTLESFLSKEEPLLYGLDTLTLEEVEEMEAMVKSGETISENYSRLNEETEKTQRGMSQWMADPKTGIDNILPDKLEEEIETHVEAYKKINRIHKLGQQDITKKDHPKPYLILGTFGIGKTEILRAISQDNLRAFNMCLIDRDAFTLPYLKKELVPSRPASQEQMTPMGGENVEDYQRRAQSKTEEETGYVYRSGVAPTLLLPLYNATITDPELRRQAELAVEPDGEFGIIYFDEITACRDSSLLDSMLTIINEREINGWRLGEKWMIIASGNRAKDLNDSDELPFFQKSALHDRFGQIWNLIPDVKMWLRWAKSQQYRTEYGDVPEFDETILDFIESDENWIHTWTPDLVKSGEMKYATPRGWEEIALIMRRKQEEYFASEAKRKKYGIKPARSVEEIELPLDQIEWIVKSKMGNEVGAAIKEYYKIARQIDPKELALVWTDWKKAPRLPNKDRSARFAYFQHISRLKAGKKVTMDEALNWINYICSNIIEDAKESDNKKPNVADVQIQLSNFVAIHPYLLNTLEGMKILGAMQEVVIQAFPELNTEVAELFGTKGKQKKK